MDINKNIKRPLIRYHGGKWKLAPWIVSHFPAHRVYIEAFGGGGSVLLRKERSYAEVYNDLDGELVNLFTVARDHGLELLRVLELTPFSRDEFMRSYENADEPLEIARRTVIRCFQGFGSNAMNKATGFRANSNRSGTTPAQDWRNYPYSFGAIIERLQGVVIENRDAKEVMKAHDCEEALHYVDPPYVANTRDKGSDYKHEMADSDHVDLSRFLSGLKGSVIVSGYPSDLYNDIYSDWQKVDCNAHADGARDRIECLWMRNVDLGLFAARTAAS